MSSAGHSDVSATREIPVIKSLLRLRGLLVFFFCWPSNTETISESEGDANSIKSRRKFICQKFVIGFKLD